MNVLNGAVNARNGFGCAGQRSLTMRHRRANDGDRRVNDGNPCVNDGNRHANDGYRRLGDGSRQGAIL